MFGSILQIKVTFPKIRSGSLLEINSLFRAQFSLTSWGQCNYHDLVVDLINDIHQV